MTGFRFSLAFLVALSFSSACGDDDSSTSDGGSEDAAIDTSADTAPDVEEDAEVRAPEEAVPPSRLARETSACPEGFQDALPAGFHDDFDVDGEARRFGLTVPSAEGPRPLFVYFHGTGGDAEEFFDGVDPAGSFNDDGYIVLGLEGNAHGYIWPVWDAQRTDANRDEPNPDLAFFDQLVDCVAAHHEVDENRIYVGGISAGGIMANFMLGHRSELLAGGIPASGMIEFTHPVPAPDLGTMAVLVSWGGDNDEWGGTIEGTTVPTVNFAEQAAMASGLYESADMVRQIHCEGDDLGHFTHPAVWDVARAFFAAHPKGYADNPAWELPATGDAPVTCREGAASYTAPVEIVCESAETGDELCVGYCQAMADCVGENGTVRPILAPQLESIGFTGSTQEMCGGCVAECESDRAAGRADDEGVLECLGMTAGMCGPGISGAMPIIDAVNRCCDPESVTDSQICTDLCEALRENDVAIGFFGACAE